MNIPKIAVNYIVFTFHNQYNSAYCLTFVSVKKEQVKQVSMFRL